MEKKSILVVEDDIDLCNLMLQSIHEAGYQVIGSASLRDANFRLKNQKYHCILLDMKLGADGGEQLVEQIRNSKDSPNKTTPVIVVSGFLDADLVKKLAGQIQGAVVKPFEMKAVLDLLAKLAK